MRENGERESGEKRESGGEGGRKSGGGGGNGGGGGEGEGNEWGGWEWGVSKEEDHKVGLTYDSFALVMQGMCGAPLVHMMENLFGVFDEHGTGTLSFGQFVNGFVILFVYILVIIMLWGF